VGGSFAGAIVALLLFFFGIVTGAGVGDRLAERCVTRREYWLCNLAIFLVGALVCALVLLTPFTVLVGLAIGLVAGAIAGLKMAFGESVGPWKAHDKFFRVNKNQVRRGEDGERAEAVRRARRDGSPEPELISVQDPAASSAPGRAGAAGRQDKNKRK
jgi:hypothetical protein